MEAEAVPETKPKRTKDFGLGPQEEKANPRTLNGRPQRSTLESGLQGSEKKEADAESPEANWPRRHTTTQLRSFA